MSRGYTHRDGPGPKRPKTSTICGNATTPAPVYRWLVLALVMYPWAADGKSTLRPDFGSGTWHTANDFV